MNKANPNGKPLYKKWWFWTIIVVLVLGVIGMIGGGESGTDNSNSSNNQTQSQNESQNQVSDANANKDKLQAQVDLVNEWYTGTYRTEALANSGDDYSHYMKVAVINGFRLNGESIEVVVDHNRMKAEGYQAEELTRTATGVLYRYPASDLDFDNFKSENYADVSGNMLGKYDIYYE